MFLCFRSVFSSFLLLLLIQETTCVCFCVYFFCCFQEHGIILYGQSVGSGPTCFLASERCMGLFAGGIAEAWRRFLVACLKRHLVLRDGIVFGGCKGKEGWITVSHMGDEITHPPQQFSGTSLFETTEHTQERNWRRWGDLV